MKRLLLLCLLCLLLGGCPFPQTGASPMPDLKTRTVFVDFEAGTVSVDWCAASVEKPPCVMCGEFTLEYEAFRQMTDKDLTAEIVKSIQHAELRTGEACQRKTR